MRIKGIAARPEGSDVVPDVRRQILVAQAGDVVVDGPTDALQVHLTLCAALVEGVLVGVEERLDRLQVRHLEVMVEPALELERV
jgi:hypothetical protein